MKNSLIKISTALAAVMAFTSCDKTNDATPGASTEMYLYASNNANGDVTKYDVSDSSMPESTTYQTESNAADGVYYDAQADAVIQVSRTSNTIEAFTGIGSLVGDVSVSIGLGGLTGTSGATTMTSPRELAVNGNLYVVADNADVDGNTATADGRLFIYTKTSSGFQLRNVVTTDFKLWGITFIGNDLYAVVDATNQVAVFNNFLSNTNNSTVLATKKVAIEGLVRTHGITYDMQTGTMVLTDIGSATNTQDDGGFFVITDFMSKFNGTAAGGTIASSATTKVSGSMTMMGNPVDVAYDGATKTVYIAEAGNGGGRILAYSNVTSGGNMAPSMNSSLAAASAVYLHKK